ncbi:DnaC-like helicase loader [Baekduia alba]|uniref:ATP-binding protein n=1 Tax=Baekduia alba TaxID=2997333 RepID=UPI00233FAA05|nr:ATP-binding protein [Baekduia alba]WCB96455.1 DnaC-like helicase loader [Baekduia alba]
MLDPDFDCPNGCDANGFLFDETTRSAYACTCREERLRRQVHADMEDNVGRYAPSRFQNLDFSELPLSGIAERHTAAASVVRRFGDRIDDNIRKGQGLWLLGNKGTGKTTLAYYVAQQARAGGFSVLTRNTTDLLNEIRDSYKVDAQPTTREIINAVTHVDLLHLEDVAVPRPNDWVLEQLYTIVNRRYEYNKAIVFTSDFPFGEHVNPAKLGEHIGERTYSRLMQMVGDPIPMTGADYRMQVGA